ncbi:hypothetical protein BC629DRAFT_373476 [Irpex lacteus]|nr:hypothetical protein BC629DRAFT_373476 [Irpex lacteus]
MHSRTPSFLLYPTCTTDSCIVHCLSLPTHLNTSLGCDPMFTNATLFSSSHTYRVVRNVIITRKVDHKTPSVCIGIIKTWTTERMGALQVRYIQRPTTDGKTRCGTLERREASEGLSYMVSIIVCYELNQWLLTGGTPRGIPVPFTIGGPC